MTLTQLIKKSGKTDICISNNLKLTHKRTTKNLWLYSFNCRTFLQVSFMTTKLIYCNHALVHVDYNSSLFLSLEDTELNWTELSQNLLEYKQEFKLLHKMNNNIWFNYVHKSVSRIHSWIMNWSSHTIKLLWCPHL